MRDFALFVTGFAFGSAFVVLTLSWIAWEVFKPTPKVKK